jgi:ankyrin repeat protein
MCQKGQLDIVKFLLNCESNLNIHDNDDQAFCVAVDGGHLDVIQLLITKNIDCTVDNNYALHSACDNGFLHIVKYLIEICNISITDDAIAFAANNGHVHVIEYLHQNGFPINELSLIRSSYNGHLSTLKYLVKHGGIPTTQVMSMAINGHRDNIIYYLLEISDDYVYNELLCIASFHGNLKLVKYLIDEKNVDISYNDYTAMCIAADNNQIDVIKYFLERGANIEADNYYMLRTACNEGYFELVKYLIKLGSDIHILEDYPLLCSAHKNHDNIVKYLLEHGANINSKNNYVFKLACSKNYYNILKLAIEYKTNVNCDGIVKAVKHNFKKIVKYILENTNISIDIKNQALEIATLNNNFVIIRLLLKHGAHVTKQVILNSIIVNDLELFKFFARHFSIMLDEFAIKAIELGHVDLFKYLYKYNNDDVLFIYAAIEHDNLDIIKLLIHKNTNIVPYIRFALEKKQYNILKYLLEI